MANDPISTAYQATPPALRTTETHSVALGYLLWIFGIFGTHRFYFGKWKTGLLWMFTGGLFVVGWIYDAFVMSSMQRQAEERFRPGPFDYNVAWALLLLAGPFGVHRFYLGKIGTGILWLCTGGLLGIGLFYDLCTLNTQVSDLNSRAV